MADESGIHGAADFFSMVAYVADHRVWREFDIEWRAALTKHGAPYLHMREFAHFRGAFKGWSEERRQALMHDLLLAITARDLQALGVALRVDDFDRLPVKARDGYVGPYLVCFYELIWGLGLKSTRALPFEPVDFVYSRQDEFRKMMRRAWAHAKEAESYGRRLGVLEFQDMRDVPGLQAADLLGWEFRHYYHLKAKRPELSLRFPFEMLLRHQEWVQSKTLKYLPGWYLQFQAAGIINQAMDAMYSDSETWEYMLDEIRPPLLDTRDDLRRLRVLERYIPYDGWTPRGITELLSRAARLPGVGVLGTD